MTKSFLSVTTILFVVFQLQGGEFTDAEKLFTLKVKPTFSEKCNGCHGDDPEKIKGDYNMLTREKLLAPAGLTL